MTGARKKTAGSEGRSSGLEIVSGKGRTVVETRIKAEFSLWDSAKRAEPNPRRFFPFSATKPGVVSVRRGCSCLLNE